MKGVFNEKEPEPKQCGPSAQKLQEKISGCSFSASSMYSLQSWALTSCADGTEMNNVDLATRENSKAAREMLRQMGGRHGSQTLLFIPPYWLLSMANSGQNQFGEGAAWVKPLL